MSATIVSDLQLSIDGTPLDAQKALPLLCEAEVDLGVQQQGMIHLQLGAGQDANGDWARTLAHTYIAGKQISADVRIGASRIRLLNGLVTQSKLNFSAEIHESKFEVTGTDVLEKVKRSHNPQNYKGELTSIVQQVLARKNIPVISGGDPVPNISVSQTDSDLDFLIMLGRKYNREIWVESTTAADTAYFRELDFPTSTPIQTDLKVNQGSQTNVRNAQFYFDLTGPTRVEANNIGANGKPASQKIYSDLRDTPKLSQIETDLLGTVDFALISRLNREGQTTVQELQTRCDQELQKTAWVVVGKGELDTAAYGDLLFPRRTVNVWGCGSLFAGQYMVWKVTHSFKREVHCQRFELRRKLGMMQNGGS